MTPLFKNSFFVMLSSLVVTSFRSDLVQHCFSQISLVGPFELDPNNTVRSKIEYSYYGRELIYYKNREVFETATLYRTNDCQLASYARMVHTYEEPGQTILWQLPIYEFLTTDGLRIKLELRITDGRLYQEDTFDLYPINTETFNPFLTNNRTYESKVYAFEKPYNLYPINHTAKYDFSLLEESTTDNNVYFEYPNCSFQYEAYEDFSYGEAYIKFYDTDHLFNFYRTSSDGYKHIPLILEYDNSLKRVNVSMKQSYYVNRETMKISDIYRNNFELTDKFYLPYNFKNYSENYEFSVHLIDIGADKLDVIFPLSLAFQRSKFGLCNNSDYCVIGGIVEWLFFLMP